MKFEQGCLLRIFVSEKDHHGGMPLYEWIAREAKNHGLSGATVIRACMGYGAHEQLRTTKVLDLAADLPMVIEIIDTAEKIQSFLPLIDGAIAEGLSTLQPVEMKLHRL